MLTLFSAGFTQPPYLTPISDRLIPGELLAIVGPNGAGKSTLISLLSGYRRPDQGCVCLDGTPLHCWKPEPLAHRRALVSQQVSLGFDWPVRDLVALGSDATRQEVDAAMSLLELTPFAARGALSLSGGETQRVMIARALCQLGMKGSALPSADGGGILLLDEPTSALDIGQQQRLMRLLRRLAEARKLTVCCVLHDLNLAARYAHRVWLMDHGERIACGPPATVLTAARLARVFGADLEPVMSRNDGVPMIMLAP